MDTMLAPPHKSVNNKSAAKPAGEAPAEAAAGNDESDDSAEAAASGGGEAVPQSNFERCPFCGRLARPCILMFDDYAYARAHRTRDC